MEKAKERRHRIRRAMRGLSRGVLIHFQSQTRHLPNKKAVRAISVTIWMMVTAQPWTEALARGVKMRRAYMA
jgi:hypothetical protein